MYSRELKGAKNNRVTLGPSGWVYINTFVLYDTETESLWYPFPEEHLLRCVSGTLADSTLPEIPSVRTTWDKWVKEHPNSKILKE